MEAPSRPRTSSTLAASYSRDAVDGRGWQSVRLRTGRLWLGAALCSFGLVLVSCSQNSSPAEGAISGTADPCVGPATLAHSALYVEQLPVTIYLTRDSRRVDHRTVRGTHAYRFIEPAGNYVVSEGRFQQRVRVTVRPGRTTVADIHGYCD